MTSHVPTRWLCATVAVCALPLSAAQPQAWAPYSSDTPWGGGRDDIAAGASGRGVPAPAFRSVEFAEATCRQVGAALPLSFTMPSSFAIRPLAASAGGECLWGTAADLERVLRDPHATDFTGLLDGVFRSRVTPELHYDARTRKLALRGGGTLASWRQHPRWSGYTNLHLIEEQRAGQPALRLVADAPGGAGRVYMLYLGGAGERDVVLISYHPSARGQAAADATWARFVEGIQRTRAASPTT